MSRFFTIPLLLACALLTPGVHAEGTAPVPKKPAALAVAELTRDMPVDFEKEVLPFLKNNCLACHNTTKAKAGLNLETPQFILKGGDSGPAAVPGQSAESLVFKAAAHLDPETVMPPKDNKANASDLKPEQLALLKLWIDQGAKGEVRAAAPVAWLEKPPTLEPILAVALTQDGQFAACGRGNRIDVYHVPSRQLVTRLADPQFATNAPLSAAAHRDVVNALSFNADGTLLASAGYREVKLWRRPRDVRKPMPALTELASLFALSPDRQWLAAADANYSIALIGLASGQITRKLVGHSSKVTSLKFSPDNQRLLSGSADQTLRVWNVADGALAASLEIPAEVNAVAWVGDGTQVASGAADSVVRLFELGGSRSEEAKTSTEKVRGLDTTVAALKLFKELKGHTAAVTSLDALPGGKELLSGSTDGTARRWKIEDGESLREFKHDGAITAVAVRTDGKRFATAGTNGLAKLWNAEDGKLVATLEGDRYADERVAETERALVIAKGDVEFRKKSNESAETEHKKQNDRVAKAAETNSATEKIFAEKDKAFQDAGVAKTNSETALTNLLAEIEKVTKTFETADSAAKDIALKAKASTAKATEARIAADRAVLAKAEAGRIAADAASVAAKSRSAADTADAAKETAQRIAEESAAVAEKSRAFADAVASDADMKSKFANDAFTAADQAIEQVAALAFAAGQLKPGYDKMLAEAPDRRKAATNQINSSIKSLASAETEFKKAETRKSVTGHELELAQQALKRAADKLTSVKTALATVESAQKETESALAEAKKLAVAAEQPIRALAFSSDGATLATVGDDRRVHTWSGETGAAFEVLGQSAEAGDSDPAFAVGFLDAQTLLAVAGERFVAWNLRPAWTLVRTLGTGDLHSPLADRVNAVRFSPDGQTLATGGGEPTRSGEIKLWNPADGQFLREFASVHSDAVLSLDFSPDGQFLASSSADRFVRVTDLAGGKVVKAFEGHTSYVLGVAWKRDSRTLASAGADNVIKVWDFVTGERKKNIEGANKEVTSIAFVGATGESVSASGDGQVRLLRENGEKVRSFEGATDFMNCAAATPDGLTIVAGGQDGVLRIWNGSDGKLVASLAPPSAGK